MLVVASWVEKREVIHSENPAGFSEWITRLTIKLDRLIVLSNSSLLGWFLYVSLIVIIKGRSPMEVSLIVIIKQVWAWLSLIIKPFHHFSPNLSNSAHDSPDQTHDRIKILYSLRISHPTPPWLLSASQVSTEGPPPKKRVKRDFFFSWSLQDAAEKWGEGGSGAQKRSLPPSSDSWRSQC